MTTSSSAPERPATYDYHEHMVLTPRPATTVPAAAAARAETVARGPNVILAALQLLVGYQWLVSGVDKLLYGHFPDQLGQLVSTAIASGRLPDLFVQFLQSAVLPNAVPFGFMVEFGETLAGLGLLAGALLTLARPALERRLRASDASAARFARFVRPALATLGALSVGAALGALFMGLNYYVLDGLPAPWFTPSLAYGGAIHPALFVGLASAMILVGQIAGWITTRRR